MNSHPYGICYTTLCLGSDLNTELLNLYQYISSPQNVVEIMIKLGDARNTFSEVNQLLRLLLTIPVSSVTAEQTS